MARVIGRRHSGAGRRRAFQLLEVVLATSIFFLVSLFVLDLIPIAQWATARTESRLFAENQAFSQIERLRSGPFSALTLGEHSLASESYAGREFSGSYDVKEIPGTDPSLVLEVRVTVRWQEKGHWQEQAARSYLQKVR